MDPADQAKPDKYPARMRTRGLAVVRRWLDEKSSIVVAKIRPGAVLRMRRRGYQSPSCPEGWLERAGGGFVCGKHLRTDREAEPGPSPEDSPDLLVGLRAAEVVRDHARAYREPESIRARRPFAVLKKSSVLTVKGEEIIGKTVYVRTRGRLLLDAAYVALLPPASERTGLRLPKGAPLPGGIVTAGDARAFAEAGGGGKAEALSRWSVVPSDAGRPLASEDGWVALTDGRFLRDDAISRYRPAPRPSALAPDERWIAVDIGEQLLHAYEGDRLVFAAPCSTGIEDNTEPGSYRIASKRRIQTLRPEPGLRVEDVQWLMYYDVDKGIAIHAAYWHDDFGARASHGCVNLARDDARWLFEWSAPSMLPEDSERYAIPGDVGTQVIVFR